MLQEIAERPAWGVKRLFGPGPGEQLGQQEHGQQAATQRHAPPGPQRAAGARARGPALNGKEVHGRHSHSRVVCGITRGTSTPGAQTERRGDPGLARALLNGGAPPAALLTTRLLDLSQEPLVAEEEEVADPTAVRTPFGQLL